MGITFDDIYEIDSFYMGMEENADTGAFDQWEYDYCEFCHKPYEECICNIKIDDDENI